MNLNYLKKYNNLIIIGHNNPDTDSIVSEILIVKILKSLGIESKYGILEDSIIPNRTKKYFNKIDYNPIIIKKSEINKYNYFLVDHNDVKQSIKNEKQVVGGIDHHIKTGNNEILIEMRCSTSLLIYKLFKNIYKFDEKDLNNIYLAVIDDTKFGISSRYYEEDKILVKEMGFDSNLSKYFDEYFIETNFSDLEKAFSENAKKEYNFDGTNITCTAIERLSDKHLNKYKEYVKKKKNFLGVWTSLKNPSVDMFLNYNNTFYEKHYDYLASSSQGII